MSRLATRLSLVLLVGALAVPAMALNVVNTSAPQINCVFSTTCTVTVTDMSSPIFGGGFLQSRIYQGQPGSPAAGKWVYEYRLDLTNAQQILNVPYATSVATSTGPVLNYDYDFNGTTTDQVFVVTSGGLGSDGISTANQFWGYTTFNFSSTLWAGSTSYFWGYTSNYPPIVTTCNVNTSNGNIALNCYAPNW